ncbi:unnamed protein product [Camellia sinensis]
MTLAIATVVEKAKLMTTRKELDSMRAQMLIALAECVDLVKFVLEAISEVFPMDKSFMIISFPELSLICSSTFSTPKWECGALQVEKVDRNGNISNNSIVESISAVDISPDDVVGVIGQKQFWKAIRAIVYLLPDHEETYNHEVLPSPPCKRVELSFSKGIGRTYKKFSFEEMKKLIEGVEKYGGKYYNWKIIKKLYFEDSDRSKDQWK